ncbi:hypothetical protein [Microvirga massiliensis]|uniref:hypothetical protein n=1 Tax=Microvirga massiliensis TaxID=1033741 RepID=UPI0006999AD4|nr:hypothetical protein [Microvirga massiliensis]
MALDFLLALDTVLAGRMPVQAMPAGDRDAGLRLFRTSRGAASGEQVPLPPILAGLWNVGDHPDTLAVDFAGQRSVPVLFCRAGFRRERRIPCGRE